MNALVLVVASGWVLHATLDARSTASAGVSAAELEGASAPPSTAPSAASTSAVGRGPTIPTKAQLVASGAQWFGVSYPEAPFGRSRYAQIAASAGAKPTIVQYFVQWDEDFRAVGVAETYAKGALPVVSWEPWEGERQGLDQPAYSLASIASGAHDAYITRFATAVRDNRWPIALRFAHEMNGSWYSWSERRSGNRKGDFVRAWRHVHDVFTRVGATNVVWVWSPNILRPVPKVGLRDLYPGNRYVDWVGVVGYATGETTADAVFGPTIAAIRRFTLLPLLITETAAEPGPVQARWTADFFRWLRTRSDVVGFVWFQLDKTTRSDWRFDTDPKTRAAFRDGVAAARLRPPLAT